MLDFLQSRKQKAQKVDKDYYHEYCNHFKKNIIPELKSSDKVILDTQISTLKRNIKEQLKNHQSLLYQRISSLSEKERFAILKSLIIADSLKVKKTFKKYFYQYVEYTVANKNVSEVALHRICEHRKNTILHI